MKVKELIDSLSTFNPEMDVVTVFHSDGSETAIDIGKPILSKIIRSQNKEYWMGPHDFCEWYKRDQPGEEVVLITTQRAP